MVLAPTVEETLNRDKNRSVRTVGERWVHLAPIMTSEIGDIGLWVDSTELDASATVDEILRLKTKAMLT